MRASAAPLLAFALGVLEILAACSGDHARYEKLVERMDALAVQVDAGFDRVAPHARVIFSDTAWDDPAALIAALDAAREGMAGVLSAQEDRIRVEQSILELSALDQSPDTRVLYRMDVEAQQAKRAVFVLSLEMYEALAAEARAGNRETFAELANVYRAGVESGNRRFRDLDRQRQERQQAAVREPPSI